MEHGRSWRTETAVGKRVTLPTEKEIRARERFALRAGEVVPRRIAATVGHVLFLAAGWRAGVA